MNNRKHKLPATIVGLCLIGMIGFKDTGIFVKEFISINENEDQIVFNKEENVNILREMDEAYIVEKDGSKYEVPMNALIRTTKKTQKYIVIKDSYILDKPNGSPIRLLNIDEIVQALKFEDNYGVFNTEDGVNGYISLSDIKVIEEDTVSYGISKIDKVLENKGVYYTLLKGEIVAIKDFKEDTYTIIDEKGNEFKVNEKYIELKRTREKVSRGNVSRRTTSVTKVVEAAYKALNSKYVSGDTGKKGYDCSGLTYSIYLNQLDIKLNRTSRDQSKNGVEVKKADLIPGDLVFFRTGGKNIGHVGLYIGDNNMIHASSGRRKVMISSLDEAYYKTRYVTARRIINN